ncbi:unnamed protein product [Lactuca virosa]|uniref:Uncharacterized protein n=1 Tax=Lactuca virosa TaxID=75947 RepID=A0AAU9NYD4_9ASTR|nr:unnamed protein product [Lactuca virosa]
MKLRPCITSHFISVIEDGMVKKVHNRDSDGSPIIRFKNLKDIYKAEDAMLQNGYDGTKFNSISTGNEHTNLPFADRKTKTRNGYAFEEDQPESSSNEDSSDELTLSQFVKKSVKKKRKASESGLTLKTDYDDLDLSQPLFKFRVKAPKTSPKKMPAKESFPGSVNVKVEESCEVESFEFRKSSHCNGPASFIASESGIKVEESFECRESTHNNMPATFIASESGVVFINHELKSNKSGSSTNEGEVCEINKASLDDLDDTKDMVLDNEENMEDLTVSSMEEDSSVEDLTTSTSDYSQSQPTPEEVNYICDLQDSVNADVDLNTLNSENICVSEETPIIQDQPSVIPPNANADSEEKFFNHDYQTDIMKEASVIRNPNCIEPRNPERLPSTRKAISPTSQEKLCMAMKSPELLDDMDHYKCKEKLSFEEQPDNKFSSTTSNINYSEPNALPQQEKAVISPKTMLKKPKSYKKGSPPEKSLLPKGCLDGPRLCRSLPRLSTGCTTVEGCSESAIAFSQRQMHDIESLASKLMSELNSMKVIVEEKLLFEAYRSPSLKNEADEVKSAIKSATKTEESAKKWLSMMTRDCNRFCKIMKLNEDNNDSGSVVKSMIEEKAPPVVQKERERKKISFADEAGGMLCDIKVYEIEIEQNSLELKQNPE